mgnify:CR=1 FL=1|jgi:hypothetical protein
MLQRPRHRRGTVGPDVYTQVQGRTRHWRLGAEQRGLKVSKPLDAGCQQMGDLVADAIYSGRNCLERRVIRNSMGRGKNSCRRKDQALCLYHLIVGDGLLSYAYNSRISRP